MNTATERIKERIDLVSFLQGYLTLQKAGINYKGVCPFHKEKTPSFFVSPEKQIWHCFGCGVGGDAFGFLMKFENVEFPEALRILADRAGVSLQEFQGTATRVDKDLYGICDVAADCYHTLLFHDIGKDALTYLRARGLTDETIRAFRVGYVPSRSDVVKRYFATKHIPFEKGEAAGLFLRKNNEVYDRFRGRIMFPIEDRMGRTVGFTGRIFEADPVRLKERGAREGKYVNTPETSIFNKSKLLYGFSATKQAIRERDYCVMVEGQMDFLVAYQAGLRNLVATSGTALTVDHLRALMHLTKHLIFIFDADAAGAHATERAIDLAQSLGFEPRVSLVPEGKDPGEYFVGKKADMTELEKESLPAAAYFYQSLFTPDVLRDTSYEGMQNKFTAVRAFLEKIARIPSATERGYWLGRVSDAVRVRLLDLQRDLESVMQQQGNADYGNMSTAPAVQEIHVETSSRLDMLFDEIIARALRNAEAATSLTELVSYCHPVHKESLHAVLAGTYIPKEHDSRLLLMQGYLDSFLEGTNWERELQIVAREYKLESLRTQIQEKNAEVQVGESRGDEARVGVLLLEINNLLTDLQKVELED
ncbi:MAG: DNA primase [Patescibacteria group bacterium]|nr:DNA primase [Patescibacteria group bacterium]MDE2438657.1 DNA primase [Patescibacteria group bacterium]